MNTHTQCYPQIYTDSTFNSTEAILENAQAKVRKSIPDA